MLLALIIAALLALDSAHYALFMNKNAYKINAKTAEGFAPLCSHYIRNCCATKKYTYILKIFLGDLNRCTSSRGLKMDCAGLPTRGPVIRHLTPLAS